MHVGRENNNFNYEMDGEWVNSVEQEKDVGVIISNDLKVSKQCIAACNIANRMLGYINKYVEYKSAEVMTKLYNSYVRPFLEYGVRAWMPYYKQDVERLEAVQHRATKMILGMNGLTYEERLKALNMYSMKRRYLRGDMIEVYKMFSGLSDLKVEKIFALETENRTRGHSKKLKKSACRLDVRKCSFGHRVVNIWNKLPESVVESDSLDTFKRGLDCFMDDTDLLVNYFH
jgi:hypothetical protein